MRFERPSAATAAAWPPSAPMTWPQFLSPRSWREMPASIGRLDDVIYGCANQAGEDNRNVARMALLLAGLPKEVPGATVNRLCGSSMEAVASAARAIKSGEADLVIAGGVESMSRAPFVIGKSDTAFSRSMKMEDTTIGWRFVNPLMKAKYGTDTMPETGEIVAEEYKISRWIRMNSRCAASNALRLP